MNYNAVPYDKRKPFDPSGIRMGTPAITSRGFKEKEILQVADFIDQVINNFDDEEFLTQTTNKVKNLCSGFPAPGLEHI